jgi:hypothetical protein
LIGLILKLRAGELGMSLFSFRGWAFRALTFTLLSALISCSITVFAAPKAIGELSITPIHSAEGPTVTVDGIAATNGRTLFASSVVSTPEDYGAVINLSNSGRLQLDPKTTFTLSDEGSTGIGDLKSGSVTLLSSNQPLTVKTLSGGLVTLNVGETVDAHSQGASRRSSGSMPSWGWAALVGAVVAVVIIAVVVSQGNDNGQVSPVR